MPLIDIPLNPESNYIICFSFLLIIANFLSRIFFSFLFNFFKYVHINTVCRATSKQKQTWWLTDDVQVMIKTQTKTK